MDVNHQPLLDETRLRVAVGNWAYESGRRLHDRRRDLGFSQEQLAGLVGVRGTAISKFELGLVVPKPATQVAVACSLLCEVTDIWPPMERITAMAVARAEVAA